MVGLARIAASAARSMPSLFPLLSFARGRGGTQKPIPLRSSLPHPVRGGRATDGDAETVCLISFYKATTPIVPASPSYGLLRDAAGNLFSTTVYGGTANLGTVFEVTTKAGRVLHSFRGTTDGAQPYSGLIRDGKGNLYSNTGLRGRFVCLRLLFLSLWLRHYFQACFPADHYEILARQRRDRKRGDDQRSEPVPGHQSYVQWRQGNVHRELRQSGECNRSNRGYDREDFDHFARRAIRKCHEFHRYRMIFRACQEFKPDRNKQRSLKYPSCAANRSRICSR